MTLAVSFFLFLIRARSDLFTIEYFITSVFVVHLLLVLFSTQLLVVTVIYLTIRSIQIAFSVMTEGSEHYTERPALFRPERR